MSKSSHLVWVTLAQQGPNRVCGRVAQQRCVFWRQGMDGTSSRLPWPLAHRAWATGSAGISRDGFAAMADRLAQTPTIVHRMADAGPAPRG